TDGLAGVADGRPVGEVEIGPVGSPAAQLADVLGWAAREQVPVRRATYGERRRLGPLSWRVVAPVAHPPLPASGDRSGDENNASLVLRLRHPGLRVLLTGDIEPEAQQALLRAGVDVRADVLKVPHHGSRYQDAAFLAAVGADVAVVSAGADNDYGHPAEETMTALRRGGARTYRTDVDGDVAVVLDEARISVHTSD
ncbi:MAG: ComEC/Rec2 family competence protein, partial [Actinomycetota bacterium]|nr:ComEC/Rec2 family competence protein [Actinomycetota bacterium]MDQ4084333.1 ComEC/Rec2 family competence protein [Actinomycetota bacterium]